MRNFARYVKFNYNMIKYCHSFC